MADTSAISPLSGGYLLIVLTEPHSEQHKQVLLERLAKGLASWDVVGTQIDIESELRNIAAQCPHGEEVRNGEKLIQLASDSLVTEILIHPQLSTLKQCMRNLLASFTRHRHVIHAGYTLSGPGSWILQDGTYEFGDFLHILRDSEVQRLYRAYESSITMDLHCADEGQWSAEQINQEPAIKAAKISINPDGRLNGTESGQEALDSFVRYVSDILPSVTLDHLLEPSDVVGNIRFSHPTLYVFPGGQGDSALFGISGFNILVDGGFGRKPCFWDFTRHLDRLDAVVMTRSNASSLSGLTGAICRKASSPVYPQVGHIFCNLPDGDALADNAADSSAESLTVHLNDLCRAMSAGLGALQLKAQPIYRTASFEPINLYHKVGHGTLDMFIISPSADSPEVKELVRLWRSGDPASAFRTVKMGGKEFRIPLLDVVSVCALLVWQPADPSEPVTRLLFPGSAPQHKILEGLEKFKRLEFLKTPVYTAKDALAPATAAATPSSTSSATAFANKPSPVKTKSTSSPRHTAEPVAVKALASRKVEASKPSKAADTNKEATPRPATAKIKAEVLSSSSRSGSTELRAKKADAKPSSTPLIKSASVATKKDPTAATLSNGDTNKAAQPKLKKDVANMKMVEARVHSFKSPASLKRAEENNKNKKPDDKEIKDKVQRSQSQSREKRSASTVRAAPAAADEKVKLVKKIVPAESPASPAKAAKPIKAKAKETKPVEPKVTANKETVASKKPLAAPKAKPAAKETPKSSSKPSPAPATSSTPSAKAVKRPVKTAAAVAAAAAVTAAVVVADNVAEEAPPAADEDRPAVEEEAFNAAEAPQAASSPKHAEAPSADEPIPDEAAIMDEIESQIVGAADDEHQTEETEEPSQPEELENEGKDEEEEVEGEVADPEEEVEEEAEGAEIEEPEVAEEVAGQEDETAEPEEAGDEVAESEDVEAADTAGLEETGETEEAAEVAVTDETDVAEEAAAAVADEEIAEEEAKEKDEEETVESEEKDEESAKEQEAANVEEEQEEEQVVDETAVSVQEEEDVSHEPEEEEAVAEQVEQSDDREVEEATGKDEEADPECQQGEEEPIEVEEEEEIQSAVSCASVEASRKPISPQPEENVKEEEGDISQEVESASQKEKTEEEEVAEEKKDDGEEKTVDSLPAHCPSQETEKEDEQRPTMPEAIPCQMFGNGGDAALETAQDDAVSGQAQVEGVEEEEEEVVDAGQAILLFDSKVNVAHEDIEHLQQQTDETVAGHQDEVLSSLSSLSEQEQESVHDRSAPSPYDEEQQPSSMESQPETHQFTPKSAAQPTESTPAPKTASSSSMPEEDLPSGSFSAAVEEEEFKAEIVHRPVPVADPSVLAGIVTPEPTTPIPSPVSTVVKSPTKEIPAPPVLHQEEEEDEGEEVEEEAFHQEIKTSKDHAVPITPTEEQAPAAFGFEPERRNEDPQLPSSQSTHSESSSKKEDSSADAALQSLPRNKEAEADEFRATIDVQYAGFMEPDEKKKTPEEKPTPSPVEKKKEEPFAVVEQKKADPVKEVEETCKTNVKSVEAKKDEQSHQVVEEVVSKTETKPVECLKVEDIAQSKPVESQKVESKLESPKNEDIVQPKPVESQKVELKSESPKVEDIVVKSESKSVESTMVEEDIVDKCESKPVESRKVEEIAAAIKSESKPVESPKVRDIHEMVDDILSQTAVDVSSKDDKSVVTFVVEAPAEVAETIVVESCKAAAFESTPETTKEPESPESLESFVADEEDEEVEEEVQVFKMEAKPVESMNKKEEAVESRELSKKEEPSLLQTIKDAVDIHVDESKEVFTSKKEETLMQTVKTHVEQVTKKEEPLLEKMKDIFSVESAVVDKKEEVEAVEIKKECPVVETATKEEKPSEMEKTKTDDHQEVPKENKPPQVVVEPLDVPKDLAVEEMSKSDVKTTVQSERQETPQVSPSNNKDVAKEEIPEVKQSSKEETTKTDTKDETVKLNVEVKQDVKEELSKTVEAIKKEEPSTALQQQDDQKTVAKEAEKVEAKKSEEQQPSILQSLEENLSGVVHKIQDIIKPAETKEIQNESDEPKMAAEKEVEQVKEVTRISPVETVPNVKEAEKVVHAEVMQMQEEALSSTPEPEPVLFEKCEKYGKFESEKVEEPIQHIAAVSLAAELSPVKADLAVDRKLSDAAVSPKGDLVVETPVFQAEIKSVSASPVALTKEDIPVRLPFVAPITASSPIDGPEVLKETLFTPTMLTTKEELTGFVQTKVDELMAKPTDKLSLELEQSTTEVSHQPAKPSPVAFSTLPEPVLFSPKSQVESEFLIKETTSPLLSKTPEVVADVLSKLSPLESKMEAASAKTPEPLEIDPPATFQFKCDPLANLPAVELVQPTKTVIGLELAAPKFDAPKEETKEKTDQLKPDVIDYANVSGSSSASVTPKSPLSPNIARRQVNEPETSASLEFAAAPPPPTRFEDEAKSQPSSLDSVGVHSTTSSASWAGTEEKHQEEEEEEEEEETATLSSTPTISYLSGYEGVPVAATSKLSTIASSDGEAEGAQPPSLDSNWSSKTFDKLTAADHTARLHPEESAFSSGPSSWDDREPMARQYYMVSESTSDRSATSSIMSHITDDEYPVRQLDHPSLVGGHDEPHHVTESHKKELDVAPVSPVPSSPFSTDRSSSHGDFEANKDSLSSIQTSASSDYHLETKVDDSASAVSSTRSDYSDRSGSSVDPLHQRQQLEQRSLTPRSDISSASETTATITTNNTTTPLIQPTQQTATEVKASKAELADPKLAPHNIWLKEKDTASSPNPFTDQDDDVDHPESLPEHASSAIYYQQPQQQQQQQHLSDVESDRQSQSSVQVAEYTDEYYAQHLAFMEASRKSPHARDEVSDQEAYLYESEHDDHDQQYHPYSTKYSDSYDEADLYHTEEAINDDYRQHHHQQDREIGDHQNGNSYHYYETSESSTAGMNLGHLQHDQNLEAFEDMNRNDRTPSRDIQQQQQQQYPYVAADVYETEPAFNPTRLDVTSTATTSSSTSRDERALPQTSPLPSPQPQHSPQQIQQQQQQQQQHEDTLASWGKPLGLPAPVAPIVFSSNGSGLVDGKKQPSSNGSPLKRPTSTSNGNKSSSDKATNGSSSSTPFYVDLAYIPHHSDPRYSDVDFFRRVRARHYVLSTLEPSAQVLDALLEGKQSWTGDDKDLDVTIIPTYDSDALAVWVSANEDLLARNRIDLAPSASRCTINLQDHETSCSAYRLEF